MKKQILYMLCATALLSSCHIYKSYDRPEDITTSGDRKSTRLNSSHMPKSRMPSSA